MGKISKDKRDIYYRLAKQLNYRSRSAFKLLQIDSYFKIFENTKTIIDLCAAPGGWSQVCSQKLPKENTKIISVDLQKFSPIENVEIIIGDITNEDTIEKIISKTNQNPIDLIICDGAPDITGLNEFDVYIQSQLILNALNTCIRIIKIGGNFITKIFKGKYTNKIIQIFLCCFEKVVITKPKACRNASFESFIFCEGFKIDNLIIKKLREEKLSDNDIIYLNKLKIVDNDEDFDYEKFNVDFIQVGNDEYDSDKTYDLESTNYQKILNPVQMPINPPYKYYVENLKGKNVKE
jgi:tRNA (cytidine32/guanosine34-2'-O)-methyltransferase